MINYKFKEFYYYRRKILFTLFNIYVKNLYDWKCFVKPNNSKKSINTPETKESNDIKILLPTIDSIFMQLRRKANPDMEKEWKDLFSEKITLTIDSFLKELCEEVGIQYYSDIRIDELREYIDSKMG